MRKWFRFPRIVAPLGVLALVMGGSAWAAAATSSSVTSNDLGYQPGALSGVPSWKAASIPKGRVTPPPPAPPRGSTPVPGTKGIAACGGAPTCRLTGISTGGEAPFSDQSFRVVNTYAGTFDGQQIMIWAGGTLAPEGGPTTPPGHPGNPGRPVVDGGLRLDLGAHGVQQFLVPNSPGWVKITAVAGGVVSLHSESGSSLTFNLATDTYSS